jgi:hypothetical protein
VASVSLSRDSENPKRILLSIEPAGDCSLELWGLPRQTKAFRRAFDHDLVILPPPPLASLDEAAETGRPDHAEASADESPAPGGG